MARRTSAQPLDTGDNFPNIQLSLVDGRRLSVPRDLKPQFNVVLVNRGAWCPYCQLLLQAGVQGVLVGAVSIVVYTRAVASLGPTTTSLFTAAVPCVTTLAAIPLLGETPSAVVLSGVGIVTLGMALGLRTPATPR
ncbi:MAG TPA: EamA family transporter [Polyangiaceae bacterium]|nr:EamA family transporter [Polyangiaceae bacterium]